MVQLRMMDISPGNPMLYLSGAPVCPEEQKGKMPRGKLMQNQINNIEKQGIKNGEEIAGLNHRMGKVEHQVTQLTEVVTDTNLRVVKLEQQMCNLKEGVTDMDVRIETRFDKIDLRFEKIDQRFDKIDLRFEKMDQRFEKIDQRFAKMDERFNVIDLAVAKIPVIFAENAMKQSQCLIRVVQWLVSLMVVVVGVTFTAARYIH